MGMSSTLCKGCGGEIVNVYNPSPAWMAEATVVTPDGRTLTGLHDGYGRLETAAGEPVGDHDDFVLAGSRNTTWHADCHRAGVLDGRDVSYAGPPVYAPEQGHWVHYPEDTHPSPMRGRTAAA